MKLATLYQDYQSMDFDLDIATEAEQVLCDTYEQAVMWATRIVKEGRDPDTKWEWTHYDDGVLQGRHETGIMATECNEYGIAEENFLIVKEIDKL